MAAEDPFEKIHQHVVALLRFVQSAVGSLNGTMGEIRKAIRHPQLETSLVEYLNRISATDSAPCMTDDGDSYGPIDVGGMLELIPGRTDFTHIKELFMNRHPNYTSTIQAVNFVYGMDGEGRPRLCVGVPPVPNLQDPDYELGVRHYHICTHFQLRFVFAGVLILDTRKQEYTVNPYSGRWANAKDLLMEHARKLAFLEFQPKCIQGLHKSMLDCNSVNAASTLIDVYMLTFMHVILKPYENYFVEAPTDCRHTLLLRAVMLSFRDANPQCQDEVGDIMADVYPS